MICKYYAISRKLINEEFPVLKPDWLVEIKPLSKGKPNISLNKNLSENFTPNWK